jgi:hypothetical protein
MASASRRAAGRPKIKPHKQGPSDFRIILLGLAAAVVESI